MGLTLYEGNWKKIVTSQNEWVAPLVGEELRSFDAAAFAECLHIRDGVPIWEPISEAGRTATNRLHVKYPDVRSDIAKPMEQATTMATAVSHPEPAPSSCVATQRSDDAANIAPEQRRPRVPLPIRRKQTSVLSACGAGPLPPIR